MEACDILEHDRMSASQIAILLPTDSPYLHLTDAMLNGNAHGGKASVAPLLSLRQFSAFWLLVRNLQHRTEIAGVPFLLHPLRQNNACRIVHLLVVGAAVECRGHRCDAHLSLLLVPMLSWFFAFPYDDNLMFDRVALFLAAVPLTLSVRWAIRRLFRSIEERSHDFIFRQFDAPFWNAEDTSEQWLERIDVAPHIAVVDCEDEAEHDMGDVRAVVHQEHKQPVFQRERELHATADFAPASFPGEPLAILFLVDWHEPEQDPVEFLRGDSCEAAKGFGLFLQAGGASHGSHSTSLINFVAQRLY